MTKHVRLKKLSQQRASLLTNWSLALTQPPKRPRHSNLAQASSNFDRPYLYSEITKMLTRLKQMERTLRLFQTTYYYGRCRQCRKTIPHARPVAQADALYCVSCLPRKESKR